MDWLLENIAQAIIAWSVGAVMGSTTTLGWQWLTKHFARRGLFRDVDDAYMKLRLVCEPGTINPTKPGNQEFMVSDARDSANALSGRLRRAGFAPPPRCTSEEASLRQWFKELEYVRIKVS